MRFLLLLSLTLVFVHTNLYAGDPKPKAAKVILKKGLEKQPNMIKEDQQLKSFAATLLNKIVYKSVSAGITEGTYGIALECTINAEGKVATIKISPDTNAQVKDLITETLQKHQFEAFKADGANTKLWKHAFTYIIL